MIRPERLEGSRIRHVELRARSEQPPIKYSRLIMVRRAGTDFEALIQVLDNGLVVFPGGEYNSGDGDPIEAIVREVGEEGHLDRGQLRSLRNWDLLWGSFVFQISWSQGAIRCLDTCHLIQSIDHNYYGLGNAKDEEIIQTAWVPLGLLASGTVPFRRKVPRNIQRAAAKSVEMVPRLVRWYSKNSF